MPGYNHVYTIRWWLTVQLTGMFERQVSETMLTHPLLGLFHTAPRWVMGVFHCAERKSWSKSWLKLGWNTHGFFNVTGSTVQKIGRAQADFFSGSGWNLWIFMSRACCAWRNNQHILAVETVITNAACAAAAFMYRYRPLFSSAKQNIRYVTSILRHCQSRNTWPRPMNINFQSRFSAQWNILTEITRLWLGL